jgi:uncharacterized membrane protein YoaK (UPF0700 family)
MSRLLPPKIKDQAVKSLLPFILSINGGYVDTAGFLALQGLFTAHVTGNFVTLAASMVFGTSGAVAKLAALPVFCVTVALVRLAGYGLAARRLPELKLLLLAEFALLTTGCAMAIRFGPFPNGDAVPALATGMTLVVAMAVQNALHRMHLGSAPPSTLMTGTTTQIMIDLVDLLRAGPGADAGAAHTRLGRLVVTVAGFAAGCAAAAMLFIFVGTLCFAVPPLVGLAALLASGIKGEAKPS